MTRVYEEKESFLAIAKGMLPEIVDFHSIFYLLFRAFSVKVKKFSIKIDLMVTQNIIE